MRIIDDKLLKNNLKKGWTIEDFSRHCQISTEEFMTQLKRNFSKSFSDSVLRELKRNDKARRRTGKATQDKPQEKQLETSEAMEDAEASVLDELLSREEKLKIRLIEMEKNCKILSGKRNVCYGKLREEGNFLQRVYHQIEARRKTAEDLMQELEKLDKRLTAEKTLKTEVNKELEKVQNEIKTLKEVPIYCFEDGRVEMEDIEALDWSQKFHDLTSDDELTSRDNRFMQIRELAEDLPVKQVKQLAKILVLIEVLEQEEQKFILQFDKESQVATTLQLVDFNVVVH